MKKSLKKIAVLATPVIFLMSVAGCSSVTPPTSGSDALVIESWRSDDTSVWEQTVIPAFEKAHPDITVEFAPTLSTEYDTALSGKLTAGTAGDIIACRPFDISLNLFEDGDLAQLNDLPGIENFSKTALTAWQTDDGADTFCVPVASVVHGFFYNKDIFKELGLDAPTTKSEFKDVLNAIKDDGTYSPMVLGVKDQWPAALNGFYNVGVTDWKAEEGRLALINGEAKFTDPEFVSAFQEIADWAPYLQPGFEGTTYQDALTTFELGRAAINPAGSWDLGPFEDQSDFDLGWFPAPQDDDASECYINDHVDIAMGMNANSEHTEAARTFLTWLASPEAASLMGNQIKGFFPLLDQADEPIVLDDPIAQQIQAVRDDCIGSMRLTYQFLSRGEPNVENDLWNVSANVIAGTMTPEEAAELVQSHLDSWYVPPATPVK